jgi:hypothetical protein
MRTSLGPAEMKPERNKPGAWRKAILGGQAIEWLPLFSPKEGRGLGINLTGHWLTDWQTDSVVLVEAEQNAPLLIFLEHSLGHVRTTLEQALTSLGRSELLQTAPYSPICLAGLKSGSEYWIALALSWADELPLDENLCAGLELVVNEPKASQKSRHHAQRLLGRSRRGGSA